MDFEFEDKRDFSNHVRDDHIRDSEVGLSYTFFPPIYLKYVK